MKSVALYARVSSEQQAQRATIDSQLAALKERAAADGHCVMPSDLFIDEGFSGATLVRPALERLRDRVAEGEIELVYVHSPDRLARRYAYQVLLMEEFAAHGVSVMFLLGPSGQSAEDTLLAQVQGMIAEYERAKIMERYRRGKLHKARQGIVNPLSGAPYGYLYVRRSDREPARYEILLPEAKVVRQVFDALVHEQHSIGQIVRTLNEQKTPTRKGAARWDRTTVWAMLRNPAYRGEAAYGKTESVERGRLLRAIRGKSTSPRRSKGASRDRPRDQWISVAVPAIVSADVFAAAAEQLERNRRLSERNGRGHRYLLQGLTVCARCSYAFYGKAVSLHARKGRPAYSYYRCVGSDAYRFADGRVCHTRQVRVDQLDQYVWNSVKETLQDPGRLMAEWSRRAESDDAQNALRLQRYEATRILAAYERSLKRVLDAYEAGVLELAELTARSERLKLRMERARQELQEIDAQINESTALRAIIGRLQDFAQRVSAGLEQLDWLGRRQLIRTLVARVEIDDEGATVVYRLPQSGHGGAPALPPPSAAGGRAPASICQLRGRSAFAVTRESIPPSDGPGTACVWDRDGALRG